MIIQIVVITKAAFLNYYLRLDAITRVMYEVCEDAVHDGVKYLEVRFSLFYTLTVILYIINMQLLIHLNII